MIDVGVLYELWDGLIFGAAIDAASAEYLYAGLDEAQNDRYKTIGL